MLRLIGPPSLPLIRTIRWLSITAQCASKPSRNADMPKYQSEAPEQRSETPSLFEELFPEESKAIVRTASPQPRDENPQLPSKDSLVGGFQAAKRSSTAMGKDLESIVEYDNHEKQQLENISVLVLMKSSKSLSQADFLKLSPKGEHIDGWASGIIQVIPGRDPKTLKPKGHYFILFSDDNAATAYRDLVVRLHTLSRTYTPTSIMSHIPPPPGILKEGEDLEALLREFTLIPSSMMHVSIRKLEKPLRDSVQRLIANGSHPALAARRKRGDNMVLFSLDRGSVSKGDLRDIIGLDGKERNLQWSLKGIDDITKPNSSSHDKIGRERDEDKGKDPSRKGKVRVSSYIVFFKNNQEARRFVRTWHRRPLPVLERLELVDEDPPIVNAELLW